MTCGNVTITTDLKLHDALGFNTPQDVLVYDNGTWKSTEVYVFQYGAWTRVFPSSSVTVPEIIHPEWIMVAQSLTNTTTIYLVNISANSYQDIGAPSNFIAGTRVISTTWGSNGWPDPENASMQAAGSFAIAGANSLGGVPVGGRLLVYGNLSEFDFGTNQQCIKMPTLMLDMSLGPTKFETMRAVFHYDNNTQVNKFGYIVAGYGGTAWFIDGVYRSDTGWNSSPATYSITTNFNHINGGITNTTGTKNRIKDTSQTGFDTLGLGVFVCESGYILDGSYEASTQYGNQFPYQGFRNLTVAEQQAAYPWPANTKELLGAPQTALGVQGAECTMISTGLGPYGTKWLRELKICDTALNSIAHLTPNSVTIIENQWSYQGYGYGDPSKPVMLRRKNTNARFDMIAVGDNGKILLRTNGTVWTFYGPGQAETGIYEMQQATLSIIDQEADKHPAAWHSYGTIFKNPWMQYTGFLEKDGSGNVVFREWTETADLRYVYAAGNTVIIVGDGGVIYTLSGGLNGEIGNRFFRCIAVTIANLNHVCWKGDRYVATGDMGTILESPDGITWSNVTQTNKPSSYSWGPATAWDPGSSALS